MTTHPSGQVIARRFHAKRASALPKHAQLAEALAEAIEHGELALGAQVMPERELSALLGVSLGTTQKALGRLVQGGFLERRHGHGTFVGGARPAVAGTWHYRFLDHDGRTELPVYATLVERSLVRAEGPWSRALGPDPRGYVRIVRRLDVGGRFACAGELHLRASRFGRLLRMAKGRLEAGNLKDLLESEFAAPTLSAEGGAVVARLDAAACAVIGVPARTWGMQVGIVGRSFGHAPITFQRMSVPPTEHPLKLDFVNPARRP